MIRQSVSHAFLAALLACAGAACASTQPGTIALDGEDQAALKAAIAAPSRTPANVARDRYRHPYETLSFFGVEADDTIVEIWPGGGWYAEILAPYILQGGGTLGVVDHRLPESADSARERSSGYLKTSTVRRLAEAAGFRLVAESEINANPNDTTDHPSGVWTLPPTLRLGDRDRDRYVAIGESDRMTLRFVKPE